jgi:hypothetical protein
MKDHCEPTDESYSCEDIIPEDYCKIQRLCSQIYITKEVTKYELPNHLFVSYPDKLSGSSNHDYVRYVRMDSLPQELVDVINSYFVVTKNYSTRNYKNLCDVVCTLQKKFQEMEGE